MNEETTTILIDNALATGSVTALDPEERLLQELALAVRDNAPAPAGDFQLRMDAKVAAGFPRRRGTGGPAAQPGPVKRFLMRRPRTAALGVAASLLVALVVAVALGGNGGRDRLAASGGGGMAEKGAPNATGAPAADVRSQSKTRAATPAPGAAGGAVEQSPDLGTSSPPVTVPEPPISDGFVGGRNRKVERSAALTLAAPEDQLAQVGDRIVAVTDRYRGFVMRSSVTSAEDGQAGGSFDLRVPVRNLRPALRDLSGLADVKARTENADDVTASFVGARSRLQELTAQRTSLLRRLAKADTDREAGVLRRRIRLVNAQIESAESSLRDVRRRTAYASIGVTLVSKQGDAGGAAGIGDGARDLRDSLVDAANLAMRVLGVAIPIALVVVLLWAGNAWATRRRRESVLDA